MPRIVATQGLLSSAQRRTSTSPQRFRSVDGSSEHGEQFGSDEDLDASGHAGHATDESGALQGQHHLMHRGRGYPEFPLHVGFGRWAVMNPAVGIDESQVLALLVGETWRWARDRHWAGTPI